MECATDLGEAQVHSDTATTSPQHPHPTTINPTLHQLASFPLSLSVIFQHVNFHLMAPAIVHSLILL